MIAAAPSPEREPLWTRDFLLHFAASFLLAVALNFVMVVIPVFAARELHGNNRDIGFMTAAFTLAAVLVRPGMGMLLDRYGRRRTLLIALACFAAVNGAHVFAHTLPLLFLLRIALGFPWGASQTATMTVAVDLIPELRRGEGLAFFGLTFTLAGTVAPLLSLWLMDSAGFDAVFASAAVISAAAFALAVFTRQRVIADSSGAFTLRSMIDLRVGWIALATLLTTTLWGAVISFIPLYAHAQHLPGAGLFFSLDAIGTLSSRVFTGRLLDRYGALPLLAGGYAALIIALLMLGLATEPLLYGSSAVLLGMGFGVLIPTFQTMAMNLVEAQRRGAANATLYSAFDIGIGGGAIALGAFAEVAGYRAMFMAQGLFLIVPAAMFLFFIHPAYRRAMRAQTSG